MKRRLWAVLVWRTPEVHPWTRDAGFPGEEHGVDIVEGQTCVCGAGINPIHMAAGGRYKQAPDKQENGWYCTGHFLEALRGQRRIWVESLVSS